MNKKRYFFLILLVYNFSIFTTIALATPYKFEFNDEIGDKYKLEIFSVQEILLDNETRATVDQKYIANLDVTDRVVTDNLRKMKYIGFYEYFERLYKSNNKYQLIDKTKKNAAYTLTQNGKMTVEPGTHYPQVKDVPVFPSDPIDIGYSWTAAGHETQDLRSLGESESPYTTTTILPFQAKYIYERNDKYKERDCAVFSVSYAVNKNLNQKINIYNKHKSIARIIGYFKGEYFWDKNRNFITYYKAEYKFIYILANGEVWEFKGDSNGFAEKISKEKIPEKVVQAPITKEREKEIEEDVKKQINETDSSFKVNKTDEGIVINLGEVLFASKSYDLKPEVMSKLDEIAHLLKKYENFSMRVDGHTDNLGTEEYNLELSENRANAVLDYLLKKGIKPDNISAKGCGYSKPIADNDTKDGRQKNRRVEIIIDTKKENIKINN